jgi:hypothetical protein
VSDTSEVIQKLTPQQESILTKFREDAPKFLYKYRSGNANDIKTLRDGKVWISSFERLNDPRDLNLDIPIDLALRWHGAMMFPPMRGEFGEIIMVPGYLHSGEEPTPEVRTQYQNHAAEIKARVRKLGVYSMTSDPLNVLMWTHYADGFKGFCVEYPWVHEVFDPAVGTHPTNRMNYVAELPSLDLGLLIREPDMLAGWKLLFHKATDYAQEKEWRFASNTPDTLIDMPAPVSRIIFGWRADRQLIRDVVAALQGRTAARFERLEPIPGKFGYHTIPLSEDVYRD